MSPRIRVLLVDDHGAVREGLRLLLEGVPEVEVVGDVADGVSAVHAVQATSPDVVVLDISMPNLSGLDAIGAITAERPRTRVVILTRHRDLPFVREAMAAGASGYVLKQSAFSELRAAISAVTQGRQYIDALIPSVDVAPPAGSPGAGSVSGREWEVLREAATGQTNKAIAAALHIAVKTVEVHKANAMRKLGLRGRSALVRYAAAREWLREA
jgi:DNA-binding NarL/FixJ family response regulator